MRLVDHLIERHGRRRIVFLRGTEGHEDSTWRERGYYEALAAHKISVDQNLIGLGGFDEDQAFAAIQQMLSDGIVFDAIFAGDDDSAIGAIRALRTAGRAVPADVAVVGFDDVPFARYLSPALTTVRAPIEEIGREAVRQLVHLMNSEPARYVTLMRTELVIRESCGCQFASSKNSQEALQPSIGGELQSINPIRANTN